MDPFTQAFTNTMGNEGQYSNNPNDAGGETCWGITIATARANGYEGSMRDMPIETAQAIYKTKYWDVMHLDSIASIDTNLSCKLFDIGVNMGPKTAVMMLQRALDILNRCGQLYPDLNIDGSFGNQTNTALSGLPESDYPMLYRYVQFLQAKHYIEIIINNPTQKVFARGWGARV